MIRSRRIRLGWQQGAYVMQGLSRGCMVNLRGSVTALPAGELRVGRLVTDIGPIRMGTTPVLTGEYINFLKLMKARPLGQLRMDRFGRVTDAVFGAKNHEVLRARFAKPHAVAFGEGWTTIRRIIPTVEEFLQRVEDQGDCGLDNDMPVTCVDWYEASTFTFLTGSRLPTELEWHYAMLGGREVNGDSSVAVAGMTIADVCNIYDEAMYNGYGLIGMMGPVFQWMLGGWHDEYASLFETSGLSQLESSRRVIRGGGLKEPCVEDLQWLSRTYARWYEGGRDVGFRIVVDP